jgi:hypothetical protein
MTVLLGVIVVFALLALLLAVQQAVAITRMAPAGARLGSFFPLGWWKFGQIEARAGLAATARLGIYKRAVIAFIVFLVLGLVLSGWMAGRSGTASADQASLSQPITPSSFLVVARRAALWPGVPVES